MFDQAIADAVCERLALGLSLRKACSEVPGAKPQRILDWCDENAEFGGHYAAVRARAYQMLADEIIEISDEDQTRPLGSGGEDSPLVVFDATAVARNRLRVDSRKWMLSKMLPKVYGEKLDLNHSGRIAMPRELSDEELASIAAGGSRESIAK